MNSPQSETIQSTSGATVKKRSTIGLYSISCRESGKEYIGWSTNVRSRLSSHRSLLRQGRHCRTEMQSDFNLHGEAAFAFLVITLFDTEDEALRAEAERIGDSFKAGRSYNGIVPISIGPTWSERQARKQSRRDSRRAEEMAVEINRFQEQRYRLIVDCRLYLAYRDDATFLRLIECFIQLSGISASALGTQVVGDSHFVFELRQENARSCTLRTAKQVHDFILKYLDNLEYPKPAGVVA